MSHPVAVIVTRPQPEADRWVQLLRSRGLSALAMPLLEIVAPADTQALVDAWLHMGEYAAVMFVSGNAVQHFFAVLQPEGPSWPDRVRAWAPGPGTSEALLALGVARGSIDAPASNAAQFDSEALWSCVQGQARAGSKVLMVRGGDAAGRAAGREWLGERLVAAGAQVDTVVAYRRRLPEWSHTQCEQARRAAKDGSIWLFSSSESIENLRQLLPEQSWSQTRAIATHPRIAQAAKAAGFGRVVESRPGMEAIVASIESMR